MSKEKQKQKELINKNYDYIQSFICSALQLNQPAIAEAFSELWEDLKKFQEILKNDKTNRDDSN